MIANFLVPTRLVFGSGVLRQLPDIVARAGITRPLLVSDPIIAAAGYFRQAQEDLAGRFPLATFTGCGIDARLAQVDALARQARDEGLDGIICIGGGSVMCTGKGAAIVAPNAETFADVTGIGNFRRPALPMIMIPTTAGSGAEVSQFTIVKDEATKRKLGAGGPLSFPAVAVLDPVVLETLPPRIAALACADALTHAVEAIYSSEANAVTDALAFGAVRLLAGSIAAAVGGRDAQAKLDNMIGSTMANMACGNSKLGLAHTLSWPLEGKLDMPHGLGVGMLMPRVVAFTAPAAPRQTRALAAALGLPAGGTDHVVATAVVGELHRLYADIEFPRGFDPALFPPARIREMAETAAPGLYGGPVLPPPLADDAVVHHPGARRTTIRQAVAILEACFV